MGMEQFGIDVDVKVNTNDAKSKVSELKEDLQYLENLKRNGISLDLGVSNIDTKKIGSLIALTKSLGDSNFSKAFEISEKSLNSLKQLKETSEQIAKLNKNQVNLINDKGLEKQKKGVDDLVNQYKSAQKEVKTLQTQLSKTKDDQVITALGMQLGEKYSKLENIYKKMNDSQKASVQKMDMRNVELMERVYGKVFDTIQTKARKMQTQLGDISKTNLVDEGEFARAKKLLDGISNLNFKDVQSQGFRPFANALKDIEKLQTSISSLKKGSKLDGFNQSDLVKEWKNLQNIINSTKKDMANTANASSINKYSSNLEKLKKDLSECYSKMSDVDKKTVDTIAGFDKMKMDNGFAKSAEKMLADVKTLGKALDGINKKGVFDSDELKKYRATMKEINSSLNDGISKGALNEFNLSHAKGQIEGLEESFKRLGNVAERELKLNKFTSGMEKQLADMKAKFGEALPDKEIRDVQNLLKKLDVTPIGKIPSEFEKINSKIQEVRKNAEQTAKTFKSYDEATGSLKEVGNRFEKLFNAGAFNTREIDEYSNKIKNISQVLKGMDLKSSSSDGIVQKMLGDIKLLQAELKEIKMPDFLAQWKTLDGRLTDLKKKLSTAYDSNTFEKIERDIKETENAMSRLVQQMDRGQVDKMLNIANNSNNNLSNYFRTEADKSIKAIDELKAELQQLESRSLGKDIGIGLLIADIAKLKSELKTGVATDLINPQAMSGFNSSLEKAKNSAKEFKKAINDIEKGANSSLKEYSKLSNELLTLEKAMSKAKSSDGMDGYEKKIAKVKAEMKSLYEVMGSANQKMATSIDSSRMDKLSTSYLAQIDRMKAETNKLDGIFKNIGNINSGQLSKLKNELKEIGDALGSGNLDGRQLAQLQNRIQSVANATKGFEKVSNFSKKIESELNGLESSTKSPRIINSIKEIRRELEQLGNMPVGSNGIDKQMSKIENSLRKVESSARRTGTFFNDLYDSMRTFTLGNIIGDAITTGLYSAKETLIGLDSALRDMMKVAPADFSGTSDQLKQVKNDAIETAKAVGTSSEDVIQGMSKALQTGIKNMGDALEVAKQSTILANVGDVEQGVADKYVTSIMSAYGGMDKALQPVQKRVQGMGKDYSNLTNFIDQANYAGNNFAISTGDVGEALQRSGSVLSGFGVEMQDSIALIIGAQESVQDSAKVGMGLKSMAVNMAGVKASAKDGTLELNKTAKSLKEIAGIDVYSNKKKGELKDMMSLFQELSTVWGTMSNDNQRAVAESIAGKHHINTLMALMNNWDTVLQYQKEYKEGWTIGSAEQENQRYLDSAEGKINILKENLKSLLTTTISTDMFKGLLDGAIGFTGALNNIIQAFDKIGMSVPLAVGAISTLFSTIKTMATGQSVAPNFLVSGLGNLIKKTDEVGVKTKTLQSTLASTGSTFVSYNGNAKKLTSTYNALPKSFEQASAGAKKFSVSQNQVSKTGQALVSNSQKMSTAFNAVGRSTALAGAKSMAMNVGLTMLNGAMIGLATAGVAMAIKAIDDYVHRVDKAREANKQQMQETQQGLSNYKSQSDSLRSIQSEYDTLKNKTNRTSEESARLLQLTQQIAQIMPELVVGYDSDGNAIINMRGDVSDLIGDLDTAIQKQAQLLSSQKKTQAETALDKINQKEMGGLDKGANVYYDTAKEKLNAIEKDYSDSLKKIKTEREKILDDLGKADESKRDKYQQKLEKNLKKEMDLYDEYSEKYANKFNEIQGYSNEVGDYIFPRIQMNTDLTDKVKSQLMSLQGSLDFSDLSKGEVKKAEKALVDLGNASASGEINIGKLKKEIDSANKSFNEGEMSFKDYHKVMSEWATKASEVTGGQYDYGFWYDLFEGMSEGAIKADRDVDKFLQTFNKSKKDIASGDDIAGQLQRQFNAVGDTLDDITKLEPNVDIEPVVEMSKNKDLPTEIRKLLGSLTSDGNFSMEDQQIAIDVMLAFQQGDTESARKALEGINKQLEAEGKPTIDIEALFDDKEAKQKVDEFNKSLEQFKDKDIIAKIKMDTKLDQKGELDALGQQLDKFKDKETKLSFIADCGDAFKGVTSLDEAIKKIPESKKLQYNVGIEKGSELEKMKQQVDSLPKEIRTMIYTETIGTDKLELVQQLVEKFGSEEAVAKLNVQGAPEALADCTTLDEFLNWLDGKQVQSNVNVEGAQESKDAVQETEESMDEFDGSTASGEVDVEGAEETAEEVDNVSQKIDEVNGKEVKMSVNKGELQGSVEEFSKLIEYSTKLKDGEYQLSFKSDTADAITQINNLKESVNQLSGTFGKIPNTSININTAQSAQNLSGLMTRIEQTKSALSSLSSKNVNINTALSAQNLSGLIARVEQYKSAISGVTSRDINVNTALSAQNISGLIRKIQEYNGTPVKNITISCNAKSVASQIQSVTNALRNLPSSKTVTVNIRQNGSMPSGGGGGKAKAKSAVRSISPTTATVRLASAPTAVEAEATTPTSTIMSALGIKADTIGMQLGARTAIPMPMSSSPIPASYFATRTLSAYASPAVTSLLSKSMPKTPIAITGKDIHDSLKFGIDLLKELDTRLKNIADRIALVDSKMKHATYKEKLKYLEEENELYKENISVLGEQADALQRQKNYYEYFLKNKGFTFDASGNMTNYEEKLLAMEREKERLDKVAEDKNKASSDYKGKDDKQKDKLGKDYDGAKKQADEYGKTLDEVKKFADEYYKVAFDEMPKVEKEFVDLNNSAKDTLETIKDLKNEMKELGQDSRYKDENRDIDDVQARLDKNEIELETAVGARRKKLLEDRIKLQQQLKKETQDLLDVEKQRREVLMTDLGEYGFEFRDDGSIVQYGGVIKDLKENLTEKEFDEVFKKVEEYLDSTYKKIPDVEQDLLKLGDTVQKTIQELQEVDIAQIDKDIERADEDELLGLLKKKKELQEELVAKKKEYMNLLNEEGIRIKDNLLNQGVKFDENDNILNLDALIKEYKDAISKASDPKEKKRLQKELDGLIAGTEAYVRVTEGELPKATEEWKDAQHEVKKTDEEIKKIEDAQAKFLEDRAEAVRKATEDIMKVTQDLLQTQMDINKKQIDMLEKSMKLSTFNPSDTFEALEKQIELLEKQMSLQKQMGVELEKQKDYYKNRLVTFGIEFDENGIAKNAEKVLADIQKQMANATKEEELDALEKKFNEIIGVLGDYNGALKDIVDSQGDMLDLQLEIQGVYENMLETTKKIEDRITNILEKQVEERKKLIDEELKKRLDSLKKEQEAYNKSREEDKYAEEYEKKLKEISELKSKIESVSKDSSLSGQAKLAELLKQLEDKQKEFDDFVQDKLDKDINDKFQEEQDRIQEEADKAKDELDKKLEKEELYETIKEALETGKIKDIDGNLIDLKEALLEYEDKYGDGLSVVGGLLKKDILTQLDVSLDTMKNIEKILSNLNISDFYKSSFTLEPVVNPNNYATQNVSTVNFNDSLITVQGNVDRDVLPDLEKMIKQAEREITRNIVKSM